MTKDNTSRYDEYFDFLIILRPQTQLFWQQNTNMKQYQVKTNYDDIVAKAFLL